ncbi:hypothetical protein ABBQ38_005481 [Trebouxia sp. C0009 RCD-2024]
MSVTQPVPDREVILVEYPGYVKSPDAVVETLGGLKGLTAASTGDKSLLQLNFRPRDPLAHPVYGDRQPTQGLLLKLSRSAADTDRHAVKAEVVASVHSKFTFNGMADFQYQSVVSSSSGLGPEDGPYGQETEPLLCIPPVFTKADVPLDYAFKNFRASDRASSKTKQPLWQVSFAAQHVPQSQPGSMQGPEGDSQALQAQLQARPIWTQSSLAQQLPQIAQPDLEAQLQKLCYLFTDGPWQGAWVRRGLDPRQDSTTWRLQTLQYQLPPDWYNRTAVARSKRADTAGHEATPTSEASPPEKAAAAPSFDDIHRLAALPLTQVSVFQLCDLNHAELQQMLHDPALAAGCTEKSGKLPHT